MNAAGRNIDIDMDIQDMDLIESTEALCSRKIRKIRNLVRDRRAFGESQQSGLAQLSNRKRYFSLNVQAVEGPRMEFLELVPEWPGSAHDSCIFQNTRIRMRYNNIHSRTRIAVERTFGVWKRRFPCLSRGLTTKLLCSTTIVSACGVLHNMAVKFNDILPEDGEDEVQEEQAVPVQPPNEQPLDGLAFRQQLIRRILN